MLKTLDKILLSKNVVEDFYKEYKKVEFKTWLLGILPEIEQCEKTEQNNPWHIFNVLNHILHSVEEINNLTTNLTHNEKRILAYTMFLQDIGKPKTKTKRYSNLYKREVDSFFEHNKESKRVANRVLSCLNFSVNEQNIIKSLIEEHDWFMFVVLENDGNKFHKVLTNNLLKEQIQKLNKFGNGKKLMEYLIMIGQSDNLAQNPKLTEDSLNKIETIKNMLNTKNDF